MVQEECAPGGGLTGLYPEDSVCRGCQGDWSPGVHVRCQRGADIFTSSGTHSLHTLRLSQSEVGRCSYLAPGDTFFSTGPCRHIARVHTTSTRRPPICECHFTERHSACVSPGRASFVA